MSDKQDLFVIEYLKDLNATQAAIRAGYSEDTAHSIGWENLKKPEIRKQIDRQLTELMDAEKTEIKNRILDKLKQMIFVDEEVRNNERLKAIELMGKYLALFTDRVEISGSMNVVYLDKQDEGL
jgi:phage terminase small subunit